MSIFRGINLSDVPLEELEKLQDMLRPAFFRSINKESIENFKAQGGEGATIYCNFKKYKLVLRWVDKETGKKKELLWNKKYLKPTKHEIFEKNLGNIFTSILSGSDKETKEKFPELIEWLKTNVEEDPGTIYIRVIYQLNEILNQAYPELVVKIAQNLWAYECHLEGIIQKFEGTACCVDKSRWLLRSFMKYKETGEQPDMKIGKEEFWKPGFGTWEQWSALIDNIEKLIHGHLMEYFAAYKALIESGVKKMKENEQRRTKKKK